MGVFNAIYFSLCTYEPEHEILALTVNGTFPFLVSNKMLIIRARIHKMLVRIANREDTDQTASSVAV